MGNERKSRRRCSFILCVMVCLVWKKGRERGDVAFWSLGMVSCVPLTAGVLR